jgi:hypothetical protein
MTNPIQPTQAQATRANTTNQPVPPRTTPQNKKPETKKPVNSVVRLPSSPISKQYKYPQSQPESTPLKITFLDGDFGGQSIDLGVSIEEISHEQSSEWADSNAPGIRSECTFSKLSNRTFTVKVVFYDIKYDISHLVENLAHLHELSTGATTPPTLLWQQGELRGERVVCTSFHPTYKNPLAGSKGFHHAEVELQFKLLGGKSSPDGRGRPLSPTPLQTYRNALTIKEREKVAARSAIVQLISPCVGKEGTNQLIDLVTNNKQESESAILALEYKTFINAAVGGYFSKKTLEIPSIKSKLKSDLAKVMAEKEPGVGIQARKLAEALVSNDASGLDFKVQDIFDGLKSDFDKILSVIEKQEIGPESNHDVYKHPTAVRRMDDALSCGLSLRLKGRRKEDTDGSKKQAKEDASLLKEINELLAAKNPPTSDEEIKKAFGVVTPAEINNLKNGAPYTNKEQFYQDSSRASVGLTGYTLWSNFIKYSEKKEAEKKEEKQGLFG